MSLVPAGNSKAWCILIALVKFHDSKYLLLCCCFALYIDGNVNIFYTILEFLKNIVIVYIVTPFLLIFLLQSLSISLFQHFCVLMSLAITSPFRVICWFHISPIFLIAIVLLFVLYNIWQEKRIPLTYSHFVTDKEAAKIEQWKRQVIL